METDRYHKQTSHYILEINKYH